MTFKLTSPTSLPPPRAPPPQAQSNGKEEEAYLRHSDSGQEEVERGYALHGRQELDGGLPSCSCNNIQSGV